MKKKVFMIMVLLIVVGANAVFAQNQGKYYLEIYNISEATYNAIQRNTNAMREDSYFLVRTASGTSVRSKDKNLSLEQIRQKLLAIDPKATGLNNLFSTAQQNWGFAGNYGGSANVQHVYVWCRRTE